MSRLRSRRIILIRTGETEWDRVGRLSGATDLPLTEAGRRSIDDVEAELGGVKPAMIHTSDDDASVETAEKLASRVGGRVRPNRRLREVSLGLWEGSLASDIASRSPKVYKSWRQDPARTTPPSGERLVDAADRLVMEMARLLERSREGASAPVAFVLRPMAWAVAEAKLSGAAPSQTLVLSGSSGRVVMHDMEPWRWRGRPAAASA